MVGKDYDDRWIGGELEIEHAGVMTDVHALFATDRFAFSLPLDGGVMFFATLRGPGTVWIQSLPFSRLASRVFAAAPRMQGGGGSGGEQGGLVGGILGGSLLGGLMGGDDN